MKRLTILIVFLSFSKLVIGQFSEKKDIVIDAAMIVVDMEKADFDSDGDIDFATSSNGDDKIAWYENVNGNFEKQHIISSDFYDVSRIAIADLDLDGDLDIIAGTRTGSFVKWFENLGQGQFSQANQINVNFLGSTDDVESADMNMDGYLDIIVAGSFYIFFIPNNGNGTFGNPVAIGSTTSHYREIELVDLNQNGTVDVVYAGFTEDKIGWIQNLGNSFGADIQITTAVTDIGSLFCRDFDGDLDIDIVTSSITNDAVLFLENLGSSFFGFPQNIYVIDAPNNIQAIDLDVDNDFDLLINSVSTGEIVCLKNTGTAFVFDQTILTNQIEPGLMMGLNPDNDSDIDILYNYNFSYLHLLENDLGQFTSLNSITTISGAHQNTIWIDLDQDSDLDIISSYHSTDLVFYRENLGNDSYSEFRLISTLQSNTCGLVSGDLDNDGDLDIVISEQNGQIKFIENLGGLLFNAPIEVANFNIVNNSYGLTLSDLDGDNLLDIVICLSSLDQVVWIKNQGNHTFLSFQLISSTLDFPMVVKTADFDQDNDDDLIIISQTDHSLSWIENNGNGIFSPANVISNLLVSPSTIELSDLDNDGLLDIVLGDFDDGKILSYEYQSSGNFSSAQIINSNCEEVRDIKLFDYDSNGFVDVSAIKKTGLLTNNVFIQYNLGNGTFGPEHLLDLPQYTFANQFGHDFGDHDNDGDADLVVSSSRYHLYLLENVLFDNNTIRGRIFSDLNQNGFYDSSDIGFNLSSVISNPQSDISFTSSNGVFIHNFSDTAGLYTIYPQSLSNWHLVTDSSSYTFFLNSNFNSLDSLDFGFFPDSLFTQLHPSIIGGFPRCNTVVNYWIDISNIGTTIPSGLIELSLDTNVVFVNSAVSPDSISGSKVFWSYDSLNYYGHHMINLSVQMPDFTLMGDTLISCLNVTGQSGADTNNLVFSDTLYQILECAYDPNDKIVEPIGLFNEGYVPMSQKWLEYTIRFQNTGTDTAINIVIKDQLDPNLDWQSLSSISFSHNANVSIEQNGTLIVDFENIHLPDSNVNELASHGFVKYKIRIKDNLQAGTQIMNIANIYFDYNPAIVTNSTLNTLFDCTEPIIILASDTSYCLNEEIIFLIATSDSVNWSLNDGEMYHFGNNFQMTANNVGDYELFLSKNDNLCSYFDSLSFEVHDFPTVDLESFVNDTICQQNELLNLPNGIPNNGIYSGAGISSNFFDANSAEGSYTITYTFTDENNCVNSDSSFIVIENCLNIEERSNQNFEISPNPFHSEIVIEFNQNDVSNILLHVYTIDGITVLERKIAGVNQYNLNLEILPNGVYFVSFTNNESNEFFTRKIIKY